MKKKYDDIMNIKTTKEFKERVEIRAELEGKTLSDYVRNLIYLDLKRKRKR